MANGGVDSVSAFPVPIRHEETGRRRAEPASDVCVRIIEQAAAGAPTRNDPTGRHGIALDYGAKV